MSGNSLSKIEVRKRLVRLRNLEYLHKKQGLTITHLRSENRALKARIRILEARDRETDKIIEDLKLQIAELRRIVFGKKHRTKEQDNDDVSSPPQTRTLRSKESYKRKIPHESEVTDTKEYPIDHCNNCSGTFSERGHVTLFEEDIPLPQKKIVIKHTIHKG